MADRTGIDVKWNKPSPELSALLDESIRLFDADKKQMFGAPVYFVNNNMFAGVHQDSMFIRLSEEDRERPVLQCDEASRRIIAD